MSNSPLVSYTRLTRNHSNGRGGKTIKNIIIHHMAAVQTAKQCADYFATTSKQVSANYCIGVNGDLAMCVEEINRPWTSGGSAADNPAITIEVSNDSTKTWTVSNASFDALVNLCADICKRNGIKELKYTGDKNGNLQTHRMWDATACPGDYLVSKMPELAKRVNAILNPPIILGEQEWLVIVGGAVDKQHAEWIAERLRKNGEIAYIQKIGDATADGKVTVEDAREILRKAIGIDK